MMKTISGPLVSTFAPRDFSNWFKICDHIPGKNVYFCDLNFTGGFDQLLVFRDLEYRRDQQTQKYSVELTRQLVVHKPFSKYIKWLDHLWLQFSKRPVYYALHLFVETWARDYMQRSSLKHTAETVDKICTNLVKNYKPKETKYLPTDFTQELHHYESLLYLRERQRCLNAISFPADLFDKLLERQNKRVVALRKFSSYVPCISDLTPNPCSCHLYCFHNRLHGL